MGWELEIKKMKFIEENLPLCWIFDRLNLVRGAKSNERRMYNALCVFGSLKHFAR